MYLFYRRSSRSYLLPELPQDFLFKKNSRAHGGLARRFYVRKYKLRVEGVMCRVFFTGGIVIKNKKDMKTSKFKTTAKCGGCVAEIGEMLDKVVARDQWNIDLSTPDRVLTITSDLSDDRVIELVKEAGFKAEKLR